ncbi:MAG: hypothetical protein ACK4S3_07265 [Parvibaculum sp.]
MAIQNGLSDQEVLARAFLACERVAKVVNTVAWRSGLADEDGLCDLRTEAWIRLYPLLEKLDAPGNVYSLIWRIAELAALEMQRASWRAESRLEVGLDLDASDESDDGAQKALIESGVDTPPARSAFANKLATVGWPAGSVRASSGAYRPVRRPGRPRKIDE